MYASSSSTRLLRQFLHGSTRNTCLLQFPTQRLHTQVPRPSSHAPTSFAIRRHARRTFSSTRTSRATADSHPPGHPTEVVYSPTLEALRTTLEPEDEEDMDVLPPEEATLEMTDRAAEQLRAIAEREKNPDAALRIAVESGGCHGYQYKMELAKKRNPDDYQFSHPTVKPSNIVVDAVSLSLMKGSLIDFATELIGSSFRVVENPQAKGSGCGCGVSWELKM